MPNPVPLHYAAGRPDLTARHLRRLVVLNALCGVLTVVQWPATFAGVYVWGRVLNPSTAGPMSWADFNRAFPDLANDAAAFEWYAISGVTAIGSAVAVAHRRWRMFGVVAGFMTGPAFPFGTVAGLPTAILLIRRTSAVAYDAARRRGTP